MDSIVDERTPLAKVVGLDVPGLDAYRALLGRVVPATR